MNEPLKVGIAGYGVVGKRRRQAIDLHPGLKTVAVCDKRIASIQYEENDTRRYAHYRDLLSEDLDILFVCLSNDMASEVTVAGLEKGLHVFCEKPPGRNMSEMNRVLLAEEKSSGQKLMYGFNHRYHESVREALRIIQSKELGEVINLRGVYGKSKIVNFESDWRTKRMIAGGGILLDQGIHMVDLLRLFGGEYVNIHSMISNEYWNHDVEDNVYVLMSTGSGKIAMLHSTATEWRHRFRLELSLTGGGLVLSGILSGSKSYGAESLTVIWPADDGSGDPKEQTTRYNHDPSWANEVSDFAEAIRTGKSPLHGTSADAYKTLELVYRIYCADSEWKDRWGLSSDPQIS